MPTTNAHTTPSTTGHAPAPLAPQPTKPTEQSLSPERADVAEQVASAGHADLARERREPGVGVRAIVVAAGRRWAVGLGLAIGLLSVDGLDDAPGLGAALVMPALGYLVLAILDRPRLAWPLVLVLAAVVTVLRLTAVDPIQLFAVVAAVIAVAAVLSGRLRQSTLHLLQAPAAWLFGGAALVATLVSPDAGGVIVGVGLLLHAGWDVVLWRAERVVVGRSLVEWCAAFDVVVGVGILVVVLG